MNPESDPLQRQRRPRVVIAVGASVDGRVTLGSERLLMDVEAGQLWHSMNPPSIEHVNRARASLIDELYQSRVTLEGSGSIVPPSAGPLTDLPPVDEFEGDLYSDFLPPEMLEDPDFPRWFVVIDSRGRVRWTMKTGGEARLLVLVARATPAEYLGFLRDEQIPYLVVGDQRVDLLTALRKMADRLSTDCIVSSAGGGLNGALLRDGLVDEVNLVVSPTLIGGKTTPSIFDGPELPVGEHPTPLRLLTVHTETDGVLSLRYEVVR